MQLHSQDIRCNCGSVFRMFKTLGIFISCVAVMTFGVLLLNAVNSTRIAAFSEMFRSVNRNNTPQQEPGTMDDLLTAARRIQSYSQTLMVPVINDAYLPFAYNWLCNTKEMGLHKNMLIITTDEGSREQIVRDWPEVSAVSMRIDSLNGDKSFGQAGYLRVNIKRHQHIYRLLKDGHEILHFDLDQFWRRNPLKYLQEHRGHDLLVTQVTGIKNEYCSGFVYIFNSERTVKLWELFVKRLEEEEKEIESYADRKRVTNGFMDQVPWSKIIKNNTVQDLTVKALSLDQFADGLWYSKTDQEQESINPYVIHNNFISGNGSKKKRAKDHGHWFLYNNMTCNMDAVHKVVKKH